MVTGAAADTEASIPIMPLEMIYYQKRIQGTLFGMMSPAKDVPMLINLWKEGHLRLEEIVTTSRPRRHQQGLRRHV